MNVFDERLRRAKYSYFMAVSQRVDGFGPASFGFSLNAGSPYVGSAAPTLQRQVQTPSNPAFNPAPSAQPQIRRVRATLLRRPEAASQPFAEEPEAWTSPAEATHAAAPLWTPAPPTPEIAVPEVAAPAAPPVPMPMPETADPYGDLAQALAEGLSPTPPNNMPISPLLPRSAETVQPAEADEPVARAGRPASFAETMAINEERQRAKTAPDLKTPEPKTPAPLRARPAPAAEQASPAPTPNLPAPSFVAPEPERPAPAPVAAPQARTEVNAEAQPQPVEAAPFAPAAQPPERQAPERQQAVSAPEAAQAAPAPSIPTSSSEAPAVPEERAEPVAQEATPAVEVVAELPADSGAKAEAVAEAENEQPLDPNLPPPPELLKPLGETEREERAALEALLKEKNGGVAVRLPRRPRPNVAAKPKEPEEETPPPPPEIPLEVSQNFLARLNRFAEMEKQGETDEGALTYGRMENWQSHNPENNVSSSDVEALVNPAAPTQAAVPTPSGPNVPRPANAVPVPPSAPASAGPIPAVARFKARATSRAKEAQTAAPRQANNRDDSDEESEPRTGSSFGPSAARSEVARPEVTRPVASPVAAPSPAPQTAAPERPASVQSAGVQSESVKSQSVQPAGVDRSVSPAVSSSPVVSPNTAVSPNTVVSPNAAASPATPTAHPQAQAPSRPVGAPAAAPTPAVLTPAAPTPTPAAAPVRPSFSQVQTPVAAIQRLSTHLAQPVLAPNPNTPQSTLRQIYPSENFVSDTAAGFEPVGAAPTQAGVQARVLADSLYPQRPIVVPRVLRAGAELSNTSSLFTPTVPTPVASPLVSSPNVLAQPFEAPNTQSPNIQSSNIQSRPSEADVQPAPEASTAKVNIWSEPPVPETPETVTQAAEAGSEVIRKVAATPEAQALVQPLLQPAPDLQSSETAGSEVQIPETAAALPQNEMALPSEQYAAPLAPQQVQKAALAAWELLEQALLPVDATEQRDTAQKDTAPQEASAAAPAAVASPEAALDTETQLETAQPQAALPREVTPPAELEQPITAQPKNLALADVAASALLAQALAPIQDAEEAAKPLPLTQLDAASEALPPSLNQMQDWLPTELLRPPNQFASAFSAAIPTWLPVAPAEIPAHDFPAVPHLTTLLGPESRLAEPDGIREEIAVPSPTKPVETKSVERAEPEATANPAPVGTPPEVAQPAPLWEPLPQAEAPARPTAEQQNPFSPLAPEVLNPESYTETVLQDAPLGQSPRGQNLTDAEQIAEAQAVAAAAPVSVQNPQPAVAQPTLPEPALGELAVPWSPLETQAIDQSAPQRQFAGLPLDRAEAAATPNAAIPNVAAPNTAAPSAPLPDRSYSIPNPAAPVNTNPVRSDQSADLDPMTRPVVSPVAPAAAQPLLPVPEVAPLAQALPAQLAPVADLLASAVVANPALTMPAPPAPVSPTASPLSNLGPAVAAPQRASADFAAPQPPAPQSQAPLAPALQRRAVAETAGRPSQSNEPTSQQVAPLAAPVNPLQRPTAQQPEAVAPVLGVPVNWPTGAVPNDPFVSQPALAQPTLAQPTSPQLAQMAFNWPAFNPAGPVPAPTAALGTEYGFARPMMPAPTALAQPAPVFAPQSDWPTFDPSAEAINWPTAPAFNAPLEPFFSPETAAQAAFGGVAPAPFAALNAPRSPLLGTPFLGQPLSAPVGPLRSAENNWSTAPLGYAPNPMRPDAAPAFPVGLADLRRPTNTPSLAETVFSPNTPVNPANLPALGQPFPAPLLAQQTQGTPTSARPWTQPAAQPLLAPQASIDPFAAMTEYALRQEGHAQPLPASTQDALQRTLGTSVRDIRVVRNPAIEPALRRANAEALTVGKTVLLPAHVDLNTPAGFALAAHELTHALRHDQPNFVPEVLRRQAARPNGSAPNWQSEEAVALATEHATVHEQVGQRHPSLPAPWEPLPFWSPSTPEAAPNAAGNSSRRQSAPNQSAPSPAAPSVSMPPPAAALPTHVHAAEIDRPKASSPNPAAPAPSSASQAPVGNRDLKAPKVDLDQVARDVYQRLRDRLNEEFNRLRS